jgi:hypothetical protein
LNDRRLIGTLLKRCVSSGVEQENESIKHDT